ncbi:AbrB/MazE/SpoVT family DNA-binding domain-containing protein [Desulfatiglans anilini]|uniref:AbrB/MazE/SpoVT family DNA-binding domain-containing protein n=1 Tax=Desulfatiglans anilini TaxID=90728 RepID=UPI0004264951|nr:AbrB/MazE/SpoVT family DNA-binding domain-containing protein [Desulfatiglans anilini]
MKKKNRPNIQEKEAMPLVKVIRNGQITIPKEFRNSLKIKDGDLLEIERSGFGFFVKPKVVLDKDEAMEKFFDGVAQIREKMKGADPKEVDAAIGEAIRTAKTATAKKRKANADA